MPDPTRHWSSLLDSSHPEQKEDKLAFNDNSDGTP
jgi:hypothetical protein